MRQTILAALLLAPLNGLPAADTPRPARPNILIAIADDLSHVHTSFAGYPAVKTPALDLVARADDPALGRYLQLAVAKRPAEELFDIRRDPACLTNLAADPKHAGVKQQLARQLEDYLRQTGDARVLDGGEVWETYERYGPIRQFPPPAEPPQGPSAGVVHWWSSSEDKANRLAPQPDLRFFPIRQADSGAIRVDDGIKYQSVLGLGSSLEHSTCYNLSLLPPEQRERVMESLVHPSKGIGMNLMRLCIGTSDFAPGPFYTYDDMPAGEEDLRLERFSIERDREYVLPAIKAAQRLNPQLRFFASPWTPPPWMKTNGKYGGGSLRPERYPHYAEYLARFIEAYRAEGIDLHAITVQNEPGFGPEAYPSCRWTAAQQRDFIRDHLGPLFRARGITARIWVFDHNFNNPGFPANILRDPTAAAYVDGSAFHLYEGKPDAMSALQREFPSKSLYFTEGSVYGARGAAEIIEYFRNWSRSYNAWVTMIDHEGKPNVSGFHDCDPTIVVLDRNTLQPEYRADYYIYGQFMKFVEAGAVRIASSSPSAASAHVAFKNPGGHLVLVAANPESRAVPLVVEWKGRTFSATLAATSVATFRWLP